MSFAKKSSCHLKSPKTMVLVLWLIFSIPFVAITGWKYFNGFIYTKGMQAGQSNAVITLIQEASKCKPFPVHAGDATVNLISVECLQKQMEENKIESE